MSEAAFDRLHPAVQHHVVNTLGWRSLRPLQEAAVAPVLEGRHALLCAPTAGGKTEAALFPLLSRMLDESWGGLSVLYLCPLRALLNNLIPRAQSLSELLGRRAGIWHGDVGDAERKRMLSEPPDLLLTTPESLEAMFLSRRVDAKRLLGGARAVVVDEIHAFADDDRGWHLLAMLDRLDALEGRRLQRIGLSATVGNPADLLDWLVSDGAVPRQVVDAGGSGAAQLEAELVVDWVGSVANAAKLIAKLHRGEKRLAFADSRARVEELATALRAQGVTTFVSHSSLSADERRQAERAFSEARDCVIVATSTLELGIDVGDLDRVLQLGAPRTVASVLQRTGRTGRRPGVSRNCLFLATSEQELLQSLALVTLAEQGWVEPLEAPEWPVHLAAQQLLARVLAEGRLGRSSWPGEFSGVADKAGLGAGVLREAIEQMLGREILVEEAGVLAIGPEGERRYGRRHFMEVTSLFLTEPLLQVRFGQRHIGQLDPSSLATRDGRRPVVLLGGSAWAVGEVDWSCRVVWVQPVDEPGRSRWLGAGGALSLDVCHAIREVLVNDQSLTTVTKRGQDKLLELRSRMWWTERGATALVRDFGRQRSRWWTFAGARANRGLETALHAGGIGTTSCDDLGIGMRGVPGASMLRQTLDGLDQRLPEHPVDPRRLDEVKFSACLPEGAVERMLRLRENDPRGVAAAIGERMIAVSLDEDG